MKAVIIGVSDRSILWRHGQVSESDYAHFVQEYAQFLAKHFEDVIVTPDDGVYTDIALAFGKIKGIKPTAFYPDEDTYYGYDHLKPNFDKYNLKPIKGDWYKLNADLTKQSLVVICVGFSPGSMIEGAFIKYHQKYGKYKDPNLANIKWLIDERCIDQKLPASFTEQISGISYYSSLEELSQLIQE